MISIKLYQNRKAHWNWLAIQIVKGFNYNIFYWYVNKKNNHLFAYCCFFPLFYIKTSTEFIFGINLLIFTVQIKYQ